jgi:putative redox protein
MRGEVGCAPAWRERRQVSGKSCSRYDTHFMHPSPVRVCNARLTHSLARRTRAREEQLVVDIAISYDGNLRCSATHGPSGSTLPTDAPKDNQGNGEAFSPTDLLATALGTCILTTMAIAARHRGIELAGATMKVTKEMVSKPIRRIARLTVELHVPLDLPEEQRAALEWAARTCPVAKSVHPDIEMPIAIVWNSRDAVMRTTEGSGSSLRAQSPA